jgi:hypothetical protein
MIIIDEEYPGQSGLIKHFLLQEIRKTKPEFFKRNIIFREIGKKSKAHFVAYGVTNGRRQPDKICTSRELLRFFVK